MSRLGKYVCITYICLAIVLGGLAGYYKVAVIDVADNNPVDKIDNKDTINVSANNESKEQTKVLSAVPETKKHGQVVNIDSNLSIRKEANLQSSADYYLYNGMTFNILEKNNGWYKVKYEDIVGYVKEEYVDEYDDIPPSITYEEINNIEMFNNLIKIPKTIKVELTAYCNCAICSEAWGSETAMQTHTRIGVVAAPKAIPLGSRIFIPQLKNYKENGIFEVEDRGGAVIVKDDGTYIIDVWLPTHEEVKEFGRKKAVVFLMKE